MVRAGAEYCKREAAESVLKAGADYLIELGDSPKSLRRRVDEAFFNEGLVEYYALSCQEGSCKAGLFESMTVLPAPVLKSRALGQWSQDLQCVMLYGCNVKSRAEIHDRATRRRCFLSSLSFDLPELPELPELGLRLSRNMWDNTSLRQLLFEVNLGRGQSFGDHRNYFANVQLLNEFADQVWHRGP